MSLDISRLIEQGENADLRREIGELKRQNKKLMNELDSQKSKSYAALKKENLTLKTTQNALFSKKITGFDKVIMRKQLGELHDSELVKIILVLKEQILASEKEIGREVQKNFKNQKQIQEQKEEIKSLNKKTEELERNNKEFLQRIKELVMHKEKIIRIAKGLKRELNEKALEVKVAMGFIRDCCGNIGVGDCMDC